VIELKHISKKFNRGQVNEVTALSDVSLTFQKGEFSVIVGSNGSGKTTLLNIISGAEIPSNGSVLISQTDVTKLAEYKRSKWIARVFQNPLSGSAPDLSILDNFRLAALRTMRKKLIIGINSAFKKQVQEKIATLGMGLENKVEQAMGTLSGGQRQALTLLMGTMDNADVLLLDEPTAALDPRSAQVVMQTAGTLIKQYQLTAILITHNLKDATQYGSRLIQIQEGKVIKDIDRAEKGKLQLQDLAGWFA
jgi:putative tryptophan/tyrosine transport system ATP-binding protein